MARGKTFLAAASACMISALAVSGCEGGQRAEARSSTVVKAEEGAHIEIGADVDLYIRGYEYMDQVQPPSPRGYYDFYPETEGWRYFVLYGGADNSGEDFDPDACYAQAYVDGEVREAKLLILSGFREEFMDVLPAGSADEYRNFWLFAAVREEEEPEEIALFYRDEMTEIKTEEQTPETYDHEIRIMLDGDLAIRQKT